MSAAEVVVRSRTTLQPVARLGFDDGWLLLGPTFLGLQRPVLLMDKIHVGCTAGLGLKPFGSLNARVGPKTARVKVVVVGGGLSLWGEHGQRRELLGAHWFSAETMLSLTSSEVVLLVGDTTQ